MKVFYFTFEGIFSSVFDSQVLTPILKIKNSDKSNFNIKLVSLSIRDFFNKKYKTKKRHIEDMLDGDCFFSVRFPLFLNFPIFLKPILFLNSIVCFIVLYFHLGLRKNEKAVFHCRGHITGYTLLTLKKIFYKNISVYSDLRGILSIEIFYTLSKNEKKAVYLSKIVKDIETYVEKNSDYLSCVSESFKEKVLSDHRYKLSNIEVIPCCIDSDMFKYEPVIRKEIREKLGISNKFVLVYSGSLSGWQLPGRMVEVFKIFSSLIKNSYFLMLTNEIEYAESLFTGSCIEKYTYTIMNKPYSELCKFLSAGDLGFMLRKDDELNNISRPVKFAEYISCGVPVISSKGLKDVLDIINNYDMGFILEDPFNNREVEKIAVKIKDRMEIIKSDSYKKKISDLIKNVMSWDYYTSVIEDIYKKCYEDSGIVIR